MTRKRTASPSKNSTDVDVVHVINRTALIENILNQIIVGYCAPRKEAWEFMWSVVLDTSVMSLGAKVKVAMAAASELKFKLDKDSLHTVLALRNAFAHHATYAHAVLAVGETPEQDRSYHQLWILGSSGKITRKERSEALAEFDIAYQAAKQSLVRLNETIGGKSAA